MADTNQTNQTLVPQAEAEPPMKLKATYMPTRYGHELMYCDARGFR